MERRLIGSMSAFRYGCCRRGPGRSGGASRPVVVVRIPSGVDEEDLRRWHRKREMLGAGMDRSINRISGLPFARDLKKQLGLCRPNWLRAMGWPLRLLPRS